MTKNYEKGSKWTERQTHTVTVKKEIHCVYKYLRHPTPDLPVRFQLHDLFLYHPCTRLQAIPFLKTQALWNFTNILSKSIWKQWWHSDIRRSFRVSTLSVHTKTGFRRPWQKTPKHSIHSFYSLLWPSSWKICSPLSYLHVLSVFISSYIPQCILCIDGYFTFTAIVSQLKWSLKASYATQWKKRGSYQPRMSRKNPHLEELWRQTAVRSSMTGQTLWSSESRYQEWLNHFDFQMECVYKTYW